MASKKTIVFLGFKKTFKNPKKSKFRFLDFLFVGPIFARDSIYAIARICYRNSVWPSVWPSGRLSVTRVDLSLIHI